jgi:hypothetical protein
MARGAGIEPATDSLENCCSIRLSYPRVENRMNKIIWILSRLLHLFFRQQFWSRKWLRLNWCWKIWMIHLENFTVGNDKLHGEKKIHP